MKHVLGGGNISYVMSYYSCMRPNRTMRDSIALKCDRAVGSLVVRHQTPVRKAWVRCSMSPNTSECTRSTCLLNQWVRSIVGLFTSAGTGEYIPPLQFTCRNCGGGDRGRVAIYRPFGEVSLSLNRTVTCMVLKAQRQAYLFAHATMNFVGLVPDYVRRNWH
ncbi:hypothetical protein TNCV_1623361 [Trichonephila clavipes]|nr:hypothetical protein TNCV_1623361 [Trichonephila clavipes]